MKALTFRWIPWNLDTSCLMLPHFVSKLLIALSPIVHGHLWFQVSWTLTQRTSFFCWVLVIGFFEIAKLEGQKSTFSATINLVPLLQQFCVERVLLLELMLVLQLWLLIWTQCTSPSNFWNPLSMYVDLDPSLESIASSAGMWYQQCQG